MLDLTEPDIDTLREQVRLCKATDKHNTFCENWHHINHALERITALEVALKDLIESYSALCWSDDQWCGNTECGRCGSKALVIADARQVLYES